MAPAGGIRDPLYTCSSYFYTRGIRRIGGLFRNKVCLSVRVFVCSLFFGVFLSKISQELLHVGF